LVEENNYAKEDPKEFGNNADAEDNRNNSAKIVILLVIVERSEFLRRLIDLYINAFLYMVLVCFFIRVMINWLCFFAPIVIYIIEDIPKNQHDGQVEGNASISP
jgi:hypothetical protein